MGHVLCDPQARFEAKVKWAKLSVVESLPAERYAKTAYQHFFLLQTNFLSLADPAIVSIKQHWVPNEQV